jgi:hypothetical protein
MPAYSQVTDTDIVKAILGKNYVEVNNSLDRLGVWYHMHMDFSKLKSAKGDMKRVYSIANGKEDVKVWALKLTSNNIVDEIVINFRHDSRADVEAIGTVSGQSDFHVGVFSTDIVFKRKK